MRDTTLNHSTSAHGQARSRVRPSVFLGPGVLISRGVMWPGVGCTNNHLRVSTSHRL
jgi:hypothetical protein